MDKTIVARYAELGYPVLPLAPNDKRPLAKLVPQGLKDATTDKQTINYWLKDTPDAGAGILPPENVLVLDFDRPEAWQDLLRRYPVLESYPRQRTPSGGYHVFMRIPEVAVGKLTTSVRIMDGVDIRGLGKAYVATAPTTVKGAGYVWEVPLVPPDELPEIPAGLLMELLETARAKSEPQIPTTPPPAPTNVLRTIDDARIRKRLEGLLRWACGRVETAPEGTRHDTLRNTARTFGKWLHYAPDFFDTARQALYEAARKAGLDHGDAWRTSKDGLEYGMARPEPLPESVQEAEALLLWTAGETGITDRPEGEADPSHPLEGLSGGLLVAGDYPQYVVRNGVLNLGVTKTRNGETEVIYTPLCAFSAIIRRVIEDTDGLDSTLVYEIEGYLEDGRPLPAVRVPAKDFASLEWVRQSWGPDATIRAGSGTESHIRAAIEFLSRGRYEKVRIYRHTGWSKINGKWHYLHAGGAITDGEPESVQVELPSRLAAFALPNPPQNVEEELEAHLELLGLAEVVNPNIAFPLITYAIGTPLGRPPYPLYLAGPTRAGKTTLALLVQSAFAPGLELPAQNWASTANALEGTAFTLKDSLLLVDDFAPSANRWTREELQDKVERLVRAQVSGTGRGRLRADGRLKGDRPPRGSLLITGEDLPSTHSIRNRILFLEVGRGDVDFDKVSYAQELARKGTYAKAMAAWIRWLASRLDEVKERLEARMEELREQWKDAPNRTATALAHMQAVWEIYTEYLRSRGLELGEEAHEMFMKALRRVAARQEGVDRDADPVERFPELLQALFASGKAHLMPVEQNGLTPEEYMGNPGAWGWKFRITSRYKDEETGEFRVTGVWEPQGRHIGWVPEWPEGEGIYLIPDVAWAELNRLASEVGTPLPSKKALWSQLAEAGLIASVETGDERRFTVRKQIDGKRTRVIHVLPKALFEDEGGDDDEPPTPPSGGPSGPSPEPRLEQEVQEAQTPVVERVEQVEQVEQKAQPTAPPSQQEESGDAEPPGPIPAEVEAFTQELTEDEKMEKAPRNPALLMEVFNARPVAFNPKDEKTAEMWARINKEKKEQAPQERPKSAPIKTPSGAWSFLIQKVDVLARRIKGPVKAIEVRAEGGKPMVLQNPPLPLEEALLDFFRRCAEAIPDPPRVEVYAIGQDGKPWRVVEAWRPRT